MPQKPHSHADATGRRRRFLGFDWAKDGHDVVGDDGREPFGLLLGEGSFQRRGENRLDFLVVGAVHARRIPRVGV